MGGVDKTGILGMKSTHVLTGFNSERFPPVLAILLSCCFDMKLPKSRSTHHVFINNPKMNSLVSKIAAQFQSGRIYEQLVKV